MLFIYGLLATGYWLLLVSKTEEIISSRPLKKKQITDILVAL
jgi:hypothetical protein